MNFACSCGLNKPPRKQSAFCKPTTNNWSDAQPHFAKLMLNRAEVLSLDWQMPPPIVFANNDDTQMWESFSTPSQLQLWESWWPASSVFPWTRMARLVRECCHGNIRAHFPVSSSYTGNLKSAIQNTFDMLGSQVSNSTLSGQESQNLLPFFAWLLDKQREREN